MSDVDGHQVVQVETTPLLHIRRAGGAEERPAHAGAGAGQENLGQLLPEARLAVLEQLVGLVDNQPLHPGQRGNASISHQRQALQGLGVKENAAFVY